ncbi:MAG: 2-dehydro-3-deoxyglucarate aldolase [Chloroflexi bacterium]|nr:2-dehydro-3-deoxyglucarate aldolase [Chloroflexota bacterium]
MKARIKAGEPVFGVSVMYPSPQIVEMIGEHGFDWVMIDCEHGSMSPESAELMCLAAERRGMTPIVRPETNRPEVLMRYLDRGAMGLQVPHVNTKDEAIAAVRATKYYPLGDRGLARGQRSTGFGITGGSIAGYTEWSNRETLVCVQIEEKEGLGNLDQILTVDGVDVFFIGPTDLSQSLGYPGQRDHPIVKKAIDEAFAKIHKAGKASGTPGGADEVPAHVKLGVLYHYTHIPTFMTYYGRHFLKQAGR